METKLPVGFSAVLASSKQAQNEFESLSPGEKDAIARKAQSARMEAEMLRLLAGFVGRGSF